MRTPQRIVRIPVGGGVIEGNLDLPAEPVGVVLFAHGSGSSRHSSRNQFVARALVDAGCATLLLDLLTPDEADREARGARLRFDVELLGERVVAAADWLAAAAATRDLSVGCFGASTGAAAALIAAAERPQRVAAVVSRGGRPDLAQGAAGRVRVPTLFIVGGEDHPVLEWNEQTLALVPATDKRLAVIPGATHLFEEPGALERVAELAVDWFTHHLGRPFGAVP